MRGAIVALPAVSVLLTVVLLAIFDRSAIYQILAPKLLMSLLVLDVVALLYHLWAMADGYLLALRTRPIAPGTTRWVSATAVAVLIVGTLAIHVGFASVDVQAQQTLNCVMNANGPCIADFSAGQSIPSFDMSVDSPDPTDSLPADTSSLPADTSSASSPNSSASSPNSSAIPTPTPGDTTAYPVPPACTDVSSWAQRNCTLYILLIGGDAGIGRGSGYDPNSPNSLIDLRTDTMILLQADLSTGRSAMYSIPRNLMNVPLGKTDWNAYPDHFFPARIDFGASPKLGCGNPAVGQQDCILDFLWHDAAFVNPGKYPYPGNYFARATMAVQESIGALMGVNISGTVVVDLLGFVDLINALVPNGLTINSPYDVHQLPGIVYTDSKNNRLYNLDFPKGSQTLSGEMALAFARLRHVVGHDSDVYRMARQQLVLTALLNQVNACEVAPNIVSVLGAVKGTIWTNLDWNDAPQLASVVSKIKPGNVKTYGLTTSKGFAANVTPNPGDNSVVNVYQKAVQTGLNGAAAAYSGSGGGGGGGGGFHC